MEIGFKQLHANPAAWHSHIMLTHTYTTYYAYTSPLFAIHLGPASICGWGFITIQAGHETHSRAIMMYQIHVRKNSAHGDIVYVKKERRIVGI